MLSDLIPALNEVVFAFMSEDALMKLGKAMIEEELVRISPVKYV